MAQFNIVSQIKPLIDYLRKKQQNDKFLKSVELGATFFVISFFMFFAIRPTALTISELVGEIKSKKILVQKMRGKINDIVLAQDQFSKIQADYLLVNSALPDRPNYYHTATQILGATQQSNVPLTQLDFNLKQDKKETKLHQKLQSYSVDPQLRHNFLSLLDSLKTLQNNRRFYTLSDFSFASSKTSKKQELDPQAVGFSLSIKFYYWLPDHESTSKK